MTTRESFGRYRLEVRTHGTVRFDAQPTNSRHKHDFVEICLVLSGSGRYIHGTGEYPLHPGDVFTADPGVIHEISSHATRDLELWFLTLSLQAFDGRVPTLEDAIIERYLEKHRTLASGQAALGRYLPLIDDNFSGLERVAAGMAALFMALGMMQALAGPPSVGVDELETTDPVDLAIRYMERNMSRPLGVEELADAVGLSPRTLRRRFTARLGVGIAEEMNHRRMRRAADLLLMGFGASEAGQRVGIDAPAQFTRAFRRAMGVSPKAFQASYVAGAPGRTTRPEGESALPEHEDRFDPGL